MEHSTLSSGNVDIYEYFDWGRSKLKTKYCWSDKI